jgi:hypothetical protein
MVSRVLESVARHDQGHNEGVSPAGRRTRSGPCGTFGFCPAKDGPWRSLRCRWNTSCEKDGEERAAGIREATSGARSLHLGVALCVELHMRLGVLPTLHPAVFGGVGVVVLLRHLGKESGGYCTRYNSVGSNCL